MGKGLHITGVGVEERVKGDATSGGTYRLWSLSSAQEVFWKTVEKSLWKATEGEKGDEEMFMQIRKACKVICALVMMIPITLY